MRKRLLTMTLAPIFAIAMGACTAQKTQDGKAPDVDVEGGQLPKYDVEPADVDIGTDTTTVRVPTVDVHPDTGQSQ